MSEHDPMSCSKWSTWMVCASFIDNEETSKEAEEGTSGHDMLAKILKLQPVDGDVPAQVDWAKRVVLDMRNDGYGSDLHIEELVKYDDGNIKYSGTPDLWWVNANNELVVVDFKMFADGVSFDHFPQLMGYALAIAAKSELLKNKTINLVVLAGGSFKVVTKATNYDECFAVANAVFARTQAAPLLDRNPNSHCKYCKRAACPAAIKEIDTMNAIVPTEETTPSLSEERIVTLLDQCTVAEGVIKKLRDALKAEVAKRGGVESNGIRYEIRTENGTATLESPKELFDYLTSNGVSSDDIINSVKLGLPSASKLLRSADFTIRNDKDARAKLTQFYKIPTAEKLKKVG